MAARLELSPAELHMLKMEEYNYKLQESEMARQPVSPDKKRESLYKEPEEQERLPSEAPELTEKSFVEAVEKQLQFWRGSIRFLYEQLESATNGFREICPDGSEMLSYEGTLLGRKVFIKRYTYWNKEVLFLADVRAFSTLHHRNIAKGIGLCHHDGDLFIVEERMDEGRLREYIGSGMPSLPWDVRYKIVHDLASAILYMHEGCYHCVLHQDINSANVLLASDYCAKLASFRKLQFVYKDTESSDQGKREDVYGFGIVVLEIVTGRTPWRREELERWAEDIMFIDMDGILEVADKRLKGEFDLSQMEKLIFAGLCCTGKLGKPSPSMREVVEFLKFGTTLPTADDTNAAFVSRTSSPRGQMSPALHGVAQLSDTTTDMHQLEQALPDAASLATEHIEIGIPKDYNFSGHVNTFQAQIMEAFISTLQAKIDEGEGREKIMQIIKTFTDSLVMLRVPIKDWNSLAQHVLSELKKIEHLKETQEGDKLKMALKRKLTQHLAAIAEDRAEMGPSKENLASIEQEKTSLASISNLQKQIVETLKHDGGNDEINELKKSIIPRIEMIEHIEFAISTLHESLLFRVSNFAFDGK